MANYSSYKKVSGAQVIDKSITSDKIGTGVRDNFCTKWFYGISCRCSPGCCCLWTVPACVRHANWEIWGAGGNGNGACSCSRCHHTQGAGGGAYTSKSIVTNAGCTYRVCAGGVYRCLSRECTACNGCSSYVCGVGINACACGGYLGRANTSWTNMCYSTMPYCVRPGCVGTTAGADFATYSHNGGFQAQSGYFYPGNACHCWKHNGQSVGAPGLSSGHYEQNSNYCWIRCGCWIAPYGHGGQSATSNYCGRCCGQGGTGGGGLVKVRFY
jgi:hypothetical protein